MPTTIHHGTHYAIRFAAAIAACQTEDCVVLARHLSITDTGLWVTQAAAITYDWYSRFSIAIVHTLELSCAFFYPVVRDARESRRTMSSFGDFFKHAPAHIFRAGSTTYLSDDCLLCVCVFFFTVSRLFSVFCRQGQ